MLFGQMTKVFLMVALKWKNKTQKQALKCMRKQKICGPEVQMQQTLKQKPEIKKLQLWSAKHKQKMQKKM